MKFYLKKLIIISIYVLLNGIPCLVSYPIKMLITEPVVSLRIEPRQFGTNNIELEEKVFGHLSNKIRKIFFQLPERFSDPGQESHLLLCEKILCYSENDNWLEVEAIEQKTHSGYLKGYIEKNQAIAVNNFPQNNLVVQKQWANIYTTPNSQSTPTYSVSIGTKLHGEKFDDKWQQVTLPDKKTGYIETKNVYFLTPQVTETEEELRLKLINISKAFLGYPYCWGGRCAYNPNITTQSTSVDCSGFINLIFKACGLEISRNALDQFLTSNKINGSEVKPGDLIFFARPENPDRVFHILMYLDNGKMIESTAVGGVIISIDEEKIGKKIKALKYGENCADKIIYFSSYLNYSEKIQKLRNEALKINF